MKNVKKLLILGALSLATVNSLYAADAPAAGQQMPAPKADVYVVPEATSLPIELTYPAQIKPLNYATVYSRVLGVLEEQTFKEGSTVKKGDVLFKIEDDLYQAQVDAAQASVNMNQATLNSATTSWERIKKLYSSKAVTTEQRDTALATYQGALASLAVSKAQLREAKINLDYTKVKAPISGIAGIKSVDLGNLVTANGTQLVTISQNDKVYTEFSMPLSDYANIKSGLWQMPENNKVEVSLSVNGMPTDKKGVVDFIDANINEGTSTVKMRAVVENSDLKLMPGSFVRVTLNGIEQKGVITIPQKALLQNPMGTIVMIEENGKAAVRPVVPGKESGDKYVVAGGMLKSGDKVIVNNFFKVKPGNPVEVDKVINK